MTDGPSAWGIRPGVAWAEEVDAEEERNGPLMKPDEEFPTLGAATKEPKKPKEKKKPQKMPLGAFVSSAVGRAAPSDQEILAQLPKGSSGLPREERDPNALGGGFREYGGNREGFRGGRRDERDEREPSRADTSGDWGSERKFTPSEPRSGGGGGFGGGFRDRDSGGFGERRGGGGFEDRPRREDRPVSEADTADDWSANRKFTPSAGGASGGGGFGASRDREGGFRDRPRGFESGGDPARSDTGDWGARRGPPAGEPAGPSGRDRRGYGFSEQPASAADSEERWSHRGPPPEASGSGGAEQPAERPRLKLQPRSKPLELPPVTANGSAVPSPPVSEADSSGSGQQQQQAPAPKKSNPFGAARPREEVLKEKGIDYKKEELKLEHGEVLRDPTPEEVAMQKEVEELRVRLEGLKELTPGETDTISELQGELDEREKTLYRLQAELDDRIRFSKNRPDRERSSDSARGPAAAAAAGPADEGGFEVVRNPRRERSATASEVSEARGEADKLTGREGSGSGSGSAWGGGRGGFRDRERDGSRGVSGSREERGGGRGSGGPAAGGRGGDREERGREESGREGGADKRPGRSGGGW